MQAFWKVLIISLNLPANFVENSRRSI